MHDHGQTNAVPRMQSSFLWYVARARVCLLEVAVVSALTCQVHTIHQAIPDAGAMAATQILKLALPRAKAYLSMQARAHALLKAKETELRTAKEDAQAEHAAELTLAQRELAAISRDLTQAWPASYVLPSRLMLLPAVYLVKGDLYRLILQVSLCILLLSIVEKHCLRAEVHAAGKTGRSSEPDQSA